MKNLLTLFFLFITLISFSQTFKKGDKIQILWESKWYNGKIEEIKGDKYLVSYDGYDASWNETVGAERIKAGSVATTNTTSTSNTTSSTGTSFRSVETIWDLAKVPTEKFISLMQLL